MNPRIFTFALVLATAFLSTTFAQRAPVERNPNTGALLSGFQIGAGGTITFEDETYSDAFISALGIRKITVDDWDVLDGDLQQALNSASTAEAQLLSPDSGSTGLSPWRVFLGLPTIESDVSTAQATADVALSSAGDVQTVLDGFAASPLGFGPFSRTAWGNALRDRRTSGFTAVVGGRYLARGTFAVTDPSSPTPVAGDTYDVVVGSGSVTIGGTAFTASRFPVIRLHDGSSWTTIAPQITGNLSVTGTLTTSGAATINGSDLRVTGGSSTLPTPESVITGTRGDARYPLLSDFFRRRVAQWNWSGSNPTTASGGGALTSGVAVAVSTTTTAGSQGGARILPWPGLSATHTRRIDWSKLRRVSFSVGNESMGSVSSGAVAMFSVGKSVSGGLAFGDLTVHGVALRLVGTGTGSANLWGQVHNGTTLTNVDLGASIASAQAVLICEITMDGAGNVIWFINGTQRGTTSAGPTATNPVVEATIAFESVGNNNSTALTCSNVITFLAD